MGALSGPARLLPGAARGLSYYTVGGVCGLPELAAGEPEAFRRAGWTRAASPRHADLLLVAGPVNRKLADVLRRIHAQSPERRRVLLVGDCAQAGYLRADGFDEVLRGAVRVPGCPAEPEAVVAAADRGRAP